MQSKIFYTKIAQSTPKAQNGWHRGVTKRNVSSFFLFRLVPNLNIMKTLTLLGHAWYFVVYIIHQTLTWATGSLTCVCDPFACVYTRGTSVYSLIRRISFACHFPWLKKKEKKRRRRKKSTKPAAVQSVHFISIEINPCSGRRAPGQLPG